MTRSYVNWLLLYGSQPSYWFPFYCIFFKPSSCPSPPSNPKISFRSFVEVSSTTRKSVLWGFLCLNPVPAYSTYEYAQYHCSYANNLISTLLCVFNKFKDNLTMKACAGIRYSCQISKHLFCHQNVILSG